MVNNVLYEVLEDLAERYIPEGNHRMLHINSREAWKELMVVMLEEKLVAKKLSIITKCAIKWETILVQKISIQN